MTIVVRRQRICVCARREFEAVSKIEAGDHRVGGEGAKSREVDLITGFEHFHVRRRRATGRGRVTLTCLGTSGTHAIT